MASIVGTNNKTKHSTNKMAPTQESCEQNEEYDCNNILHGKKNLKQKCKKDDSVRTAKKYYTEGDTTNWSFELNSIYSKH